MRNLLIRLLLVVFGACPPALAGEANAQNDTINTTASVPDTSTTITLSSTRTYLHVLVKTDPAAAVLYVDFANGTATSGDFRVEPGGAILIEGVPISAFKIIGASALGTYSVLAWY